MPLEKCFLKITLSFTIYLSALVGLAIFGFFNIWFVAAATALWLAYAAFFFLRAVIRIKWRAQGKVKIACFIIIVSFSLFIGIFHHDLPTARDEFSFIYSADRLNQSGSLEWNDYFTRPMHGVRNLGGDTFTSQFLPVYSSYLAVYELFGGLDAQLWANVLLMLLTLGIIHYLVKNLANEKASLLALIFTLSSYVFFWFPKRTNVENVSIFIVWLGIWLAVKALKSDKPSYLFAGLFSFSLLPLIRPEGLIFLFGYITVVFVVYIIKFRNRFSEDLRINTASIVLTATNIGLFYFYVRFYEARYIFTQLTDVLEGFDYIYTKPAILLGTSVILLVVVTVAIKWRRKYSFQKLLFWLFIITVLAHEALFLFKVSQGDLTWTVYRSQYVLENFTYYLYFIYAIVILIGLRKKLFGTPEFIITAIMLPAFFFIVEPNIALDQPWFMRRFYPNLIPLLIILSAVAINRLSLTARQLKYVIISSVIIGLVTSRTIIFFVEHKGLKNQVEEFNKIFPKDALIVMNPGWSWQKIAIIQHYFYDYDALPNLDLYVPEEFEKDLPSVISRYPRWETDNNDVIAIYNWEKSQSEGHFARLTDKYFEIYVVTNESNSNLFRGYYDQNLEFVDNFTFKYNELKKESSLTQYIQQNKTIDLSKIRDLQKALPPYNIDKQEINLSVYRVINKADYYTSKYVLAAEDIQPDNHVYFVLKDADLNAYRQKIKDRLKFAETKEAND